MTTTTNRRAPPTIRPNGDAYAIRRELFSARETQHQQQRIPAEYLPDGPKSLPGISIRAFSLGIACGICSLSSVQLAYYGHESWRVPSFVSTLAAFHYLEFDMTARYNPPECDIGSFLLLNNGAAYTIAHTTALVETIIRLWLHSHYRPTWLRMPFGIVIPPLLPAIPVAMPILLGFVLIIFGQTIRSLAMAHAKTNFNHLVQSTKKADHILVTDGIYAASRHPSYFGYFWWALGTQLMLGNHICFLIYTTLLWHFFNHRIRNEERHLVHFFGQDYLRYRQKVGVWIPFIH